ncbi:MBL fold metallo-hydrolase [Flexivirga sp.]|uniref:MBL fold metallo-hydrolase n=1 Tax=Flexivirga sp. TaxID=1962927 RepID=UPI003F81ABEB
MDTMTFVGNATTILRIGSFTVLTDPNFLRRGQFAYLGWGLVSRRLVDPAVQPSQLPALDAVLLSHLHGDHFDRIARRQLDKEVPLLTTPQAARRLGRRGFATEALETWQTTTLQRDGEQLVVESLPAIHATGLLGRMLPPVMGSMLTHRVPGRPDRRLYISGDTLTGPHLDAIAERYPAIDAGILHCGGTRVLLRTVTMDDVQAVDAIRRLPLDRVVPVHHDDYRVFRSPVSAFIARARRHGLADRIAVPRRGETRPLFGDQ